MSSFATILKGSEVNICISLNNVTLIMINSDADTWQKLYKGVTKKTFVIEKTFEDGDINSCFHYFLRLEVAFPH